MFLGNYPLVNLVDQKALNYRRHKLWWLTSLLLLAVIFIGQRYILALWYREEIDALSTTLSQQQELAKQLKKSIDALPKTLDQKYQYKHIKLSVLIRLLQLYQSTDTRIVSISWSNKLRLEGESKNRLAISQLQSKLSASRYFTKVTLEQLRQNDQIYTFSLIIDFSTHINFALLANKILQ